MFWLIAWSFLGLSGLLIGLAFFFRLRVTRQRLTNSTPAQRRPSRPTLAFFHPYCAAGGGGERVLWAALRACQRRWPKLRYVVYTGDVPSLSPEQILSKAEERFGIGVSREAVEFVPLRSRRWLDGANWPVATLFGQTLLGGILVGLEALWRLSPHIMLDTMGAPATLPLFRLLGGAKVGCYVHYPTISSDMLSRVRDQTEAYNNRSVLARNPVLSRLKMVYYHIFAGLYALLGRASQVTMVNSSWTLGHIRSLWGGAPVIVFPPCDVRAFRALPVKAENESELRILSLGQFRPEKDHPLQLKAFAAFLDQHQGRLSRPAKLVLAGSCRGEEDEARVARLRLQAKDLGVPDERLEWRLNIPFKELIEEVSRATIGLHTMWCEHFGIAVVEAMAGGNIVVAHDSGGPRIDIVGTESGSRGFLASDPASYAAAFAKVAAMSSDERDALRSRARPYTDRFSDQRFEESWLEALAALVERILP